MMSNQEMLPGVVIAIHVEGTPESLAVAGVGSGLSDRGKPR